MPRKRPASNPVDPPAPGWSNTLPIGKSRLMGELPVPRTGEPVDYLVREKVGDVEMTYELRIPAGAPEVDLNSTIVVREGGFHGDDHAYQERLFVGVGRVTVAGGLVEAALKRVLVVLAPDKSAFTDVDMEWAKLEDAIRRAALSSVGPGIDLAANAIRLLDVADKQGLRTLRNDVAHGEWWRFAGMDGRLNRWPRRTEGHTTAIPEHELAQLGRRLIMLADGLNQLVQDRWPVITLLPIEQRSAFHRPDPNGVVVTDGGQEHH